MSLKESQTNVDVSHIHVKYMAFQIKTYTNAFQENLTVLSAGKKYYFQY